MLETTLRHVVWFSCGAASAVTAKLATQQLGLNCVVAYCDTSKDEHPDNQRFLKDIEDWIEQPILRLKGEYDSIEEVFTEKRYMSGIGGAPCTVQMKKVPRFNFQRPGDVHCFGFTAEERERIKEFEQANFDINLRWFLPEADISKEECFGILKFAGIEIPELYKLGFPNNNCIGCVKATSPKYWAKVRKYFPEIFERRAKQSREIGCRLVRFKGVRIFLDELPPGDFLRHKEESISCGPECGNVPAA